MRWARWLLMLALIALALLCLSGCMLQVPSDDGGVRICYPARSWKCAPGIEWSDMDYRESGSEQSERSLL